MTTNIRRRAVQAKVDATFRDEMRGIAAWRVATGVDKQMQNLMTLTRKLIKHEEYKKTIKPDLMRAHFIEDEKAQFSVFNLFTFMIVGFIALVLFGGLIWIMGILNTTMHNAGIVNDAFAGQAGYTNLTSAADTTFGKVNDGVGNLRLVALSYIFSMALGIFVSNFLVKIHPLFFFVYILIVMLAVFLAAPLSNAYQTLTQSNIYDGILNSFTGAGWLMNNLPEIIAVIGILGGIFLFINIVRQQDEQELR